MGLRRRRPSSCSEGREMEISVQDVLVGDTVIVRPGEQDPRGRRGRIDGMSYVDESMISGEPIPVEKKAGDNVVGGTINSSGVLTFIARKVGRDTVLAQIVRLVEEAQGSKPPVQRIADRVVALLYPRSPRDRHLRLLPLVFRPGRGLLFALTSLISILVVACPCALGLATPTAVTVGVGRGAELGILIKTGRPWSGPKS